MRGPVGGDPQAPIRILHVITGLGAGGAEAMLAKLVSLEGQCRHCVLSLSDEGVLGQNIKAAGVEVHSLGLNKAGSVTVALPRLAMLVRRTAPDLIQGWMNHGNLAASLAGRLSRGRIPVVWNVRQSLNDLAHEKWLTRRIINLDAKLSNDPAAIIYNSRAGAEQHEAIGFAASKRRLIPNGFDLKRFHPSQTERAATRRRLRVGDEEVLVGLIARFHSMKNHKGFFEAAERVLSRAPATRFLVAGAGTGLDDPGIRRLIPSERVLNRTLFLGLRSDVPQITRALDIACNVSVHGEGFPNAIGEAMASAVPCVVTDVGDSAFIAGEGGVQAAGTGPDAIAEAIVKLISGGRAYREQLGHAAFQRVHRWYSLPAIGAEYERLYREILAVPSA